jgi:hypothetical protein
MLRWVSSTCQAGARRHDDAGPCSTPAKSSVSRFGQVGVRLCRLPRRFGLPARCEPSRYANPVFHPLPHASPTAAKAGNARLIVLAAGPTEQANRGKPLAELFGQQLQLGVHLVVHHAAQGAGPARAPPSGIAELLRGVRRLLEQLPAGSTVSRID